MHDYHAFVKVGPLHGHPGHIAQVDYPTAEEAMAHITGWQEYGAEWAAVLRDDGLRYFMSPGAENHYDELLRRIEQY